PGLEPTGHLYEIDQTLLTCGGGSAASDMMLELIRLIKRSTRWLLRNRRHHMSPSASIEEFLDGATELLGELPELLRGRAAEAYLAQRDRFLDAGVPEELASRVALSGQVCQQLAQWRQGGLDAPRVSVNVSEKTLADDDFVERVATLLAENGLTGSSLCLEVPECALHPGDERMEKLLEGIRALDIGVAVDDFGAGYTSLAYLSRLPLTELKIDVSLIAELGADSRSEAVVSAIGAMCRHLDISIVAEGVETQGQHDFISGLAPVFAQGYLYSRPSLPEAIEEMLIAETPLRA
ncbi:MAG: EAL domain-containing protein, partial [Pseudomonadota bacterium]